MALEGTPVYCGHTAPSTPIVLTQYRMPTEKVKASVTASCRLLWSMRVLQNWKKKEAEDEANEQGSAMQETRSQECSLLLISLLLNFLR